MMSRSLEEMESKPCKVYAILRLRGTIDVPPDVEHTMRLLRLHKPSHLVLYPMGTRGLEGMLIKVKDWVTWGEIDCRTLRELLEKRGRSAGNRRLTDDFVRESLGVRDLGELADKICRGDILLHKQKAINPVFRLKPPSGGYRKSTRRPFKSDGELGYRGTAINELIKRML